MFNALALHQWFGVMKQPHAHALIVLIKFMPISNVSHAMPAFMQAVRKKNLKLLVIVCSSL
jgi:membrane-bound metal-dependent hydrolase YbcI (DUF457 family)